MGLAARCLRGLLGEKKSAEGGPQPEKVPTKEKKRWGFLKWSREREKGQLQRENMSDREKSGNFARDSDEQSKRAIAVAAATSTAEETAVASAHPAVTLVRTTRFRRRSEGFVAAVGMKLENRAAIKIQAAFRGYLARRALRALRGLVKLQALVRGSIVRKQAGETLRCMQALIRAQSRARDCRTFGSETTRCRSGRSNPDFPAPEIQSSRSLKRNSSKQTSMDAVYENGDRFTDWKWLDQWMEESYGDSREVSKRFYDQKNAKILEIDTGKPPQFISGHSFAAMTDSPSKVSTAAKLSITTRSSSVHMAGQSQNPLRFPIVGPEDFLSSPQLFAAASNPGVLRKGTFSPAKSHSSRSMFGGYSDYRNYMANTESFRAKARSQSAPKQITEYRKSSSMKRLSDHGFGGQLPPPEAECSGSRSALRFQFGGRLD